MIVIKDLDKVYKTGKIEVKALNKVNIHIKKGEFVAIMGASGSGKSTLMNILGCLDILTNGTYLLDKINIKALKEDKLTEIRRDKIGFVFQSFNLLPKLSIQRNVELPMMYVGLKKPKRKERAKKLLTSVGLGERLKHKPNELSGGQKQRVAIARALANNPKIILADEPTGNLDSHSEEEIMKIFKKLNERGSTIIMVTHEESVAEHAERIIRFKDGELISDKRNVV